MTINAAVRIDVSFVVSTSIMHIDCCDFICCLIISEAARKLTVDAESVYCYCYWLLTINLANTSPNAMVHRRQLNELLNVNVNYIYDYGLSAEQQSKLSLAKWFYMTFVLAHIVLAVLGGISTLASLYLLGVALFLVNIVGIVFSMAYWAYPKSRLANAKPFTNIVLVVFAMLKTAYFVVIIITLSTLDRDSIPGWDSRFDDYFTTFVVLAILISSIPLFHWLGILLVWRTRCSVAKSLMQAEYRLLGANWQANAGQHPNCQYYQQQNEPAMPVQTKLDGAYATAR